MTKPEITLPERVLLPSSATRLVKLRSLFGLITRAESVDALKSSFLQAVTSHFEARRSALMMFDDFPLEKMRPEIRDNPVMRYLFQHHAPVHEGVVMAPEYWSALCPWMDHGHVLIGPIVRDGELIGSLALTRARDDAAFDETDLADASALCLHLCAWFARWSAVKPLSVDSLTPRERQIAELVAQGLTNAQIGARLCISGETVKAALKHIFRKTGVRSRVQLAAIRPL